MNIPQNVGTKCKLQYLVNIPQIVGPNKSYISYALPYRCKWVFQADKSHFNLHQTKLCRLWQISIFYWRIWKLKTAHTSIRVVKIHPQKSITWQELESTCHSVSSTTGYRSPQCRRGGIHRDSLSPATEFDTEFLCTARNDTHLRRTDLLCNALKISEGLSNSLEPSAPHANTLVPVSPRNQATNLLYRLLQSNIVGKWAALQIDHIHSTLSWLLSLIHPPEADVPHYANIHLWRAHCLIKTLCMWIPAQHMTFGFAQSPAAVSDLALPQFLSPVLPARNTLLGPA